MNHKVIQEGFFNDVHSRHIYTEYEDERLKELEWKAFDPSIQENIVEYVSQVIKESSSIVNALEAVGAMYCIPASHFMRDNNVKGIQLNGANIVAPDLNNPSEIINIRNGGLAIYGGIIGGAITTIIFCKIKKIKILDMFDMIVPYVSLGQAISTYIIGVPLILVIEKNEVLCRFLKD